MALTYPVDEPWYYMAGVFDVGRNPDGMSGVDRGLRAGRGYGSSLESFYCVKNDHDSWTGQHSRIDFKTYNCQFCEGEVGIRNATTWDSAHGFQDTDTNPVSTYIYGCYRLTVGSNHYNENTGWARIMDVPLKNRCKGQCYSSCYDTCDSGCFNECVTGCTGSCAGRSCLTGCAGPVTSCPECFGVCVKGCFNSCTSCAGPGA